ncbi:DNA polymerase III subunit delta' [Neisseria sp. Ec49-e6-T10]|uniref:DNA polymerase III subunit delta' n=1 Tax=Neisseria sp. Ec49-e6-T10 TaxID=3140744 RepID=UPI003EBC4B86
MSKSVQLYPWQQQNWQDITTQWQTKPNAWLFVGKAHTGKTKFATFLAQALLCENLQKGYTPCGICPSCHLFNEGIHPDFKFLKPDVEGEENSKKLKQIKIETVREALQFTQLSSHRGGLRVLLISPAESMNVQAANALLKVLEEPPQGVVFLLVSDKKDKLLPTIRSRCRPFSLNNPSKQDAELFLQQQGLSDIKALLAFYSGAPLFKHEPEQDELREQLLEYLSVPSLTAYLDFAAKFDQKKLALGVFLDWMQKWAMDLMWVQYADQAYFYPNYTPELKSILQKTNAMAVFTFFSQLNKLAPYGQHTLNVKLQVESIFIDYLNLLKNEK